MPRQTGKFILKALDKQWLSYYQHFKTCRDSGREADIHDFRIQCRRLLALIELCHKLVPQARLNKVRKIVKTQLNGFNELRDTQVMLQEIDKQQQSLPELSPFQSFLRAQEQHLLTQPSKLAQTASKNLKHKFQRAQRRCKQLKKQAELDSKVLALIDQVYTTTLQYQQQVDTTQLHTLHQLRLIIKKLHYLLIALQKQLPTSPKQQILKIKKLQNLLGDIQNSAVLIEHLDSFYQNKTPARVLDYNQQNLQTLIVRFSQQQAEIEQFWNTNPMNS
jgi:CHAD domain-containing protein